MKRFFVILAAIATVFLTLPFIGLFQRAPWSSLGSLLTSPSTTEALRVSLIVSFTATLIVFILGTPLAWVLARINFSGRRFIRSLVVLPMVLPPVVGGTALLFALGRGGFIGQWLKAWFDISLPFTISGAVVAAVFVSLPFYVIAMESALITSQDQLHELENVARTLGLPPLSVLYRVTLPRVRPAMVAGLALAWARALGEFGATITFAGNLPGRTQTLPLATFLALESNPEEALALSLILVVVSLSVLLMLRDHWMPSSNNSAIAVSLASVYLIAAALSPSIFPKFPCPSINGQRTEKS